MPALIDIRRRIRSVKNTQQITKAMKMVSAAKLRRAQDAMFAARPYARKMMEVLNSLATRARPDAHPLLQEHGDERVLLVVITADKGLCGGFNANIIRAASRFLEEQQRRERKLEVDLVGRKGRDFFRRRRYRVRSEHIGLFQSLLESAAAEHGARMAAMDAATNNAGEMIDRLTLYMNKVRQAAITKEIIEVVSGAGA